MILKNFHVFRHLRKISKVTGGKTKTTQEDLAQEINYKNFLFTILKKNIFINSSRK